MVPTPPATGITPDDGTPGDGVGGGPGSSCRPPPGVPAPWPRRSRQSTRTAPRAPRGVSRSARTTAPGRPYSSGGRHGPEHGRRGPSGAACSPASACHARPTRHRKAKAPVKNRGLPSGAAPCRVRHRADRPTSRAPGRTPVRDGRLRRRGAAARPRPERRRPRCPEPSPPPSAPSSPCSPRPAWSGRPPPVAGPSAHRSAPFRPRGASGGAAGACVRLPPLRPAALGSSDGTADSGCRDGGIAGGHVRRRNGRPDRRGGCLGGPADAWWRPCAPGTATERRTPRALRCLSVRFAVLPAVKPEDGLRRTAAWVRPAPPLVRAAPGAADPREGGTVDRPA